MRDQLLGTTQPVLSISLEPGETVVAGTGEFSWMTDSILMSADPDAGPGNAVLRRTLTASSLPLSAYTARQAAGTIAFATALPGSIVTIEPAPGRDYLVHQRGFLAGLPGIEISTGYEQADGEFVLRRISGRGKAWIALSGDVIRRELPVGGSLRTRPWHIGMFDASVAVQIAQIQPGEPGTQASRVAVLSGPGAVWLQSTPLLAAVRPRLAARPLAAAKHPAFEGGAGFTPQPQNRRLRSGT